MLLTPIVHTSEGPYEGVEQEGIISWKGIRYAKPPIGNLRWRPPESPIKFSNIRKANRYADICPQIPYSTPGIYSIPSEPQSEDCLFLNIWSKKESSDTKKAVMVWIHGGRLKREASSHPLYEGHNLAQKGVVVVSFNYRLNVFGFFAHPDLVKESKEGPVGNYGILDQLKALEWIQKNISYFNGDPHNITLFGESAGAWAISSLLATPHSKGLFQRAILQSGSYLWKGPHLTRSTNAYKSALDEGEEFAKYLGTKTIKALREIPYDKLVRLAFAKHNPLSCQPIIDGVLFTDYIPRLLAHKRQSCDMLIGTNANEWSVFSTELSESFCNKFINSLDKHFPKSYKSWLDVYGMTPENITQEAYQNFHADVMFHLYCIKFARLNSRNSKNTFVYNFSRSSVNTDFKAFKAYHGVEIPFVFGTLAYENRSTNISKSNLEYADWVSSYWVNFAKNGNPNTKGLPEWKTWNTDQHHCMVFDKDVKCILHPYQKRLMNLSLVLESNEHDKLNQLILKSL